MSDESLPELTKAPVPVQTHIPVSYTHLDVYKRQVARSAGEQLRRFSIVGGTQRRTSATIRCV